MATTLTNLDRLKMHHLDEKKIEEAALVLQPKTRAEVFLICDHASNRIPDQYGDLGLTPEHREDHIAWDIGAAQVTRLLSSELGAPGVLGLISRLVIDYNRKFDAIDVIAENTHGIEVPGNKGLSKKERDARFTSFYNPYHQAIDHQLSISGATVVVSIHSFSYNLDHVSRDFDIGLLFDEFEPLIREFAKQITNSGLRVRLNEPYSGREDVISSAQTHGRHYNLPNVEIEINQRLIKSQSSAIKISQQLAPSILWLGDAAQRHN